MPSGTENQSIPLTHALNKVRSESRCGVIKETLVVKEPYGSGTIVMYKFEGVILSICDVLLKQEIVYNIEEKEEFALFSFLLSGEQLFQLNTVSSPISYEGDETYWVRTDSVKGQIRFLTNNKWREVRIMVSEQFAERHQLKLINKFSSSRYLDQVEPRILSSKEQSIISEMITDKKEGFLKRVFLEAKILELISYSMSDHLVLEKVEINSKTLLKGVFSVRELLEKKLDISYSIPELARIVGVNESSLQKQFKQVFNKTIFEFSTEVKMKRAKELLLHSNKPIYEISNEVGYRNPTHFTAAFKRLYSCTPKVYRSRQLDYH